MESTRSVNYLLTLNSKGGLDLIERDLAINIVDQPDVTVLADGKLNVAKVTDFIYEVKLDDVPIARFGRNTIRMVNPNRPTASLLEIIHAYKTRLNESGVWK